MQFSEPLRACGFAVGSAHYSNHLPGRVFPAQIVLPVNLAGIITIQAVLDTGSTWCTFNPELIDLLGDTVEDTYAPAERLIIRGEHYAGRLVRMVMRLQGGVLHLQYTPLAQLRRPHPRDGACGVGNSGASAVLLA